ncbi:hypothetical protein GCM10022403_073440 [Streptomyces coacervatus]|uniref:CAP domain-containing protein n=1 Tax=Streptomyces coacervatus TaxID=647381 RepID=A0ABP7IYI9_9ACTN
MSRPSEYENGTNGAAQGPPNVYHPRPESAPSYEEYADPAVAHGWLNAYDETREMPPVVDGPSRRKHRRSAGRGAVGRRSSGGPSRLVAQFPAPLKGAAVVGGVVVALIAGFSFAGSSSHPAGGAQGKEDSTAPAAADTAGSTAAESSGGAVAVPSSGGGADSSGTASPSPSPSASISRTPSGGATREPSTGASAPAPSRSVSGPGNSGSKPGHGQGGTKGPK